MQPVDISKSWWRPQKIYLRAWSSNIRKRIYETSFVYHGNKFNFCEHYSEQLWTTARRGNISQRLNTIDRITIFLFSSLSEESMIYVGTSINSGSESCKIPFTWLNVEGIFITVPWRGCRKSRYDVMLKRSINAARDCCWFEEVCK